MMKRSRRGRLPLQTQNPLAPQR